jgi:hypothetical protein
MAPQHTRAHEMLGGLLEEMGELTPAGADGLSALTEIRRARALVADSAQRLSLANAEVRLLVKSERYADAAALADSLLAAVPHPTSTQAENLVGLAALLGKVDRTAALLSPLMATPGYGPMSGTGEPVEVPAAVGAEVSAATARAALGVCDDTLRRVVPRVERLLESYVPDSATRAATRDAALWRFLSLAVPCLGPAAVARLSVPDRLVRMQRALAESGPAALRAQFDTLRALRRTLRPGDVSVDYTYQEAWLLAAIGDSAAATAHLDRSLDALPTLGVYLVTFPSHVAGLVRAMALRADLAARRGDAATARRWARPVVALWSRADPALQPVVARMRVIAGP